MKKFTIQQKDAALCRVAESENEQVELNMKTDGDKEVIRHLIHLGILKADNTRGYGEKARISLTEKGAEFYAKGGAKAARTNEIIEKVWKALDTLKPW